MKVYWDLHKEYRNLFKQFITNYDNKKELKKIQNELVKIIEVSSFAQRRYNELKMISQSSLDLYLGIKDLIKSTTITITMPESTLETNNESIETVDGAENFKLTKGE